MRETVRLNFEFPRSEYPFLKMLCAKLGLSLREFASNTLIKAIEDAEDDWLTRKALEVAKRIESGKEATIPLEKVKREVLGNDLQRRNRRKRKKASQKTTSTRSRTHTR